MIALQTPAATPRPMIGPSVVGQLTVARRFNGPPTTANGGYICGRLASWVGGPAKVRLMTPPPLDLPMAVVEDDGVLTLWDGDRAVAKAWPAGDTLSDMVVPAPPSGQEAFAASDRFAGFDRHSYPTCFVCGPGRAAGDGLRIFAGPVEGGSGSCTDSCALVAAPWRPDPSLDNTRGKVYPAHIWAALDCPGAFAFPHPEKGAVLLGEMTAHVERSLQVGTPCVVIGWQIRHEGRKHVTGTALFDDSGQRIGVARAVWFEVP